MDLSRLDHVPTVKLAMTTFPHSVDIDEPLSRARAMMRRHEIHQLPVTDRGALVGVISDRDITRVARERSDQARVRDACEVDAYIVDHGEPLDRVLLRMARDHIGAALVVRRGKLVGIFTVTDACRLFAEWLRTRFPGSGGDEAA